MNIANSNSFAIDHYDIHSYEVDASGSVTLPNLCAYMQESAWKHAEKLGVGFSFLIREKLVWVLAQQRIRIKSYPKIGERITVKTWPRGLEHKFYLRDFVLKTGDQEFGVGTTSWTIIDLKTRRRADRELDFQLDNPITDKVFTSRTEPVVALDGKGWSNQLNVRYSELDVNNHVNNVQYIKWILEGFDRDFHGKNRLEEITVNYLAEAVYRTRIEVNHVDTGNGTYMHNVVNVDNGRELCRASSIWKPAP